MERILIFAQTNIGPALNSLPKPAADEGKIRIAIAQILIVAGIVAVLMVAIGGLRYVFSRGNPDQVAQAKNTIIYAIVGLVICLFALSIIRFVTGRLL